MRTAYASQGQEPQAQVGPAQVQVAWVPALWAGQAAGRPEAARESDRESDQVPAKNPNPQTQQPCLSSSLIWVVRKCSSPCR